MVKNHEVGDVRGLEEVFRSQEISRASGGMEGGSATTFSEGRDVALLRRMFGHASSGLRDLHRDSDTGATDARSHGVAPATELDAPLMSDGHAEAASSGGGAAKGANVAAASDEPPWKRQSGRYWTIAAFSAVVALVVAGVTAGNAQHGPSNKSAQGAHGTVRPHGGVGTPGTTSTEATVPGSLTGAIGSAALALGAPAAGVRGSGNEPGGHVTLIGAATTTGTLPLPVGGSPGGGSSGASPGSSGSNPVTPVAAGVGNTVTTVGTSVTGLANQLGSTVPAAAPAASAAASAVSGVLDSVGHAVSATTL
ncbi:MAG TPA: hypothetical protein VIJ71_03430 [Mycobacteriales bacterium]